MADNQSDDSTENSDVGDDLRIQLIPNGQLTLVPDSYVTMVIVNDGVSKIAYKLKGTRARSIFPDKPRGTIDGHGGRKTVEIAFKPQPSERTLNRHDRVTVLVNEIACRAELSREQLDDYWRSEEARNARRLIVKLQQQGDEIEEVAV